MVPYSSDVLYTDKTRLQLLYTDVQQLKMIQMVSQPQLFCGSCFIHLMRLPLLENKVREILDKISRRRKETHQTFLYPHRIIEVVQPLLLKICLLSTALLHKNKCSTYSKYVSALFLFAPCIQYHYFQKANGKVIAKAATSILRNLIYLSDAFSSLLIEEKKCTKF